MVKLSDVGEMQLRERCVALALDTQMRTISALLQIPNPTALEMKVGTFEIADRIFKYIKDGEHHKDGLI